MTREEVIGDCRLILGDCLQALPGISGVSAVVTDPPFGISDKPLNVDRSGAKRTAGGTNTWHPKSTWDSEIDPAWGPMACAAAPVVAWFGQWRKREEVAACMPWPLRAEIVWAKDCHMGPPSPVAPRDERIWLFAEKGIKGRTFETSVWDCPVIPTWQHKHHKNEKPVALMQRLVAFIGGDLICDPFAGSGSTGVACVNLGRKFIGIEQNAEHFAAMCRRIEAAYKQPRLFDEPAPKPVQTSLLEAAA